MIKNKLTDEEELELLGLTSHSRPCAYAHYARRFNIVCDNVCPLRQMLRTAFIAYLSEIEEKKYDKQQFDENH